MRNRRFEDPVSVRSALIGIIRWCVLCSTGQGLSFGAITIEGSGTKLTGANIDIGENLGDRRGSNLLHTFRDFSVENGQSVTFHGDAAIRNIIARVSGAGASRIEGRLGSSIHGANFFLMNPNGVIISNGASIDVSGVFLATTADYLDLGKGNGRIYASDSSGATILTSDPVSSFGFTSPNPAPIVIENSSLGPPGSRMVLVGGRISFSGSLVQGGLDVAAVKGSGKVSLNTDGLAVPENMELGHIAMSQSTLIANDSNFIPQSVNFTSRTMSLRNATITSSNFLGGSAPPVRFAVKDTLRITEGTRIVSSNFSGEGAPLVFEGGTLRIRGNELVQSTIETEANGSGAGGDVIIRNTGGFFIGKNGALLSTVSEGSPASGGDIRVDASRVRIDGDYSSNLSGIRSENWSMFAESRSGSLDVRCGGRLSIVNHGAMETITHGVVESGGILIRAGSLLLDHATNGNPMDPGDIATGIRIRPETGSMGSGGEMNIRITGRSEILRGARIDSSAYGEGDGGDVRFRSGEFLIRGGVFPTGVFSFSDPQKNGATGKAGDLDVFVDRGIRLVGSGLIDSSTFGTGHAGQVHVEADSILIDRRNDGLFTGIGSDTELAEQGGNAGDVTVKVRNSLRILNGGLISAATFGSGSAGSVRVSAGSIRIEGRGTEDPTVVTPRSGIVAITGNGSSGAGGRVKVSVKNGNLVIRDHGLIGAKALGDGKSGDVVIQGGGLLSMGQMASIEASSSGAGNAGTVEIKMAAMNVVGDSLISSNAVGSGSAGGVLLETGNLILTDSEIGVRAALADAGRLSIRSRGDVRMTGSLVTAAAGGEGNGGSVSLEFKDTLGAIESRIIAEATRDGGNILIPDGRYTILDHTPLSANAIRGDGGNIFIGSDVFLANESLVTASSRFGAQGVVRIDPLATLSGGEGESSPPPLDVSDILQPECTQRLPTDTGSFIVTGKGGTPRDPGGFQPSLRLFSIRNASGGDDP